LAALVCVRASLFDGRGRGPTMRPRESSPLFVWLAIGLIFVGCVAYAIGYFMVDDISTLIK
jgi:hypothetical protein